jgi:hypothetical protein
MSECVHCGLPLQWTHEVIYAAANLLISRRTEINNTHGQYASMQDIPPLYSPRSSGHGQGPNLTAANATCLWSVQLALVFLFLTLTRERSGQSRMNIPVGPHRTYRMRLLFLEDLDSLELLFCCPSCRDGHERSCVHKGSKKGGGEYKRTDINGRGASSPDSDPTMRLKSD